jgi:NAD(P)-dependent dehydrogenase (short-subunit alcohol dehydrogenase family)
VAAEELGEQFVELPALGGAQAGEQFVLGGVGVPLDLLEIPLTGGGKRDDVAAPVGGVGLPVDAAAALEAGDDAADIVPVEAETSAEICLTQRPVLLQRRQDGVPTRSQERADEFRRLLGDAATARLHLVVHDYTTFASAEALVATMEDRLGSVDDVVAPIGAWWAGKRLWEISESDWQDAFERLAATHIAVLRAALPRMKPDGAYSIIVGASASAPIPGSGLVSMEQAALLMMQQVLAAELGEQKRVFALVLGPVLTRATGDGAPDWITAEQVGSVAVAVSASKIGGRELRTAQLSPGSYCGSVRFLRRRRRRLPCSGQSRPAATQRGSPYPRDVPVNLADAAASDLGQRRRLIFRPG